MQYFTLMMLFARDLLKKHENAKGRLCIFYFIKDAATIPHAKVQERSVILM
jgi:hypothetical protein